MTTEQIDFNSEALRYIKLATDNCALANLRKAARIITQLYDEALRPVGLTATQFTLLSVIAVNQSATINELAAKLVMDRTTVARDLKPLERDEIVVVNVGEHDQRTRQVTLTAKGQQLLMEGAPLRQEVQNRVEDTLGKDQFQTLLTLLASTSRVAPILSRD